MRAAETTLEGLIEAAQHGGCADDLIHAVWPRAYRIALSILRERSLAEDAAQESCAVLFRNVRRLRASAAFNVWFYRIVVRQAVALEKRRSGQAVILEPAFGGDLDQSLIRIDVFNALVRLPAAQRTAVALQYYAEMNSREIAAVLDMPDSSVRFHIMRAKKALQKALQHVDPSQSTSREAAGGAA